MPANTAPIYSRSGSIQGVSVGQNAMTASNGAGVISGTLGVAFIADATNGSWVSRIRLSPVAMTAATATAATTLRIFISKFSASGTVTTPADTWLFTEAAAAAQTADQTTSAISPIEIPLNFALPPSYAILVGSHVVNNAFTAWVANVFGGVY